MSIIVQLSNVRLSFPTLTKPEAFEVGGVPKYSASFLMSPTHPGYLKFKQAVAEIAVEKWGKSAHPVLNIINNDRKLRCFGDGDERVNAKTFEVYDGYAGNVYVSAGNADKPQLFDSQGDLSPVDNTMAYMAIARSLYGGCYVNAVVQVWTQDNAIARAIRCTLIGMQFFKDGEMFGEGVPDVSSMFGAVVAAPSVAAPVAAPAAPAPAPAPLQDWM